MPKSLVVSSTIRREQAKVIELIQRKDDFGRGNLCSELLEEIVQGAASVQRREKSPVGVVLPKPNVVLRKQDTLSRACCRDLEVTPKHRTIRQALAHHCGFSPRAMNPVIMRNG